MLNRTENKITIIFIRHGATISNIQRRYVGQKNDEDVCEEGYEIIRKKKKDDLYPDVKTVFVSDKKRCLETADLIYPDSRMIVIPEFSEIDFGDFEGKDHEELKDDTRYIEWIKSNGELPFPNGESKAEFCKRTIEGFNKVIFEIGKSDEDKVAIIAHGGTIMAVLSEYTDKDYYDYQVSNACGYVCEADIKDMSTLGIIKNI